MKPQDSYSRQRFEDHILQKRENHQSQKATISGQKFDLYLSSTTSTKKYQLKVRSHQKYDYGYVVVESTYQHPQQLVEALEE